MKRNLWFELCQIYRKSLMCICKRSHCLWRSCMFIHTIFSELLYDLSDETIAMNLQKFLLRVRIFCFFSWSICYLWISSKAIIYLKIFWDIIGQKRLASAIIVLHRCGTDPLFVLIHIFHCLNYFYLFPKH